MRVIARRTLRAYVDSLTGRHDQRAVKAALDAWFHEVSGANWSNSGEMKRQYASASVVDSDRVVFNIRGNRYRLVVAVDYEKGIAWIKWIGTHADYDHIDASKVEHGD
jgi:mRNA interferase HigB